jgi:hypothetical protein
VGFWKPGDILFVAACTFKPLPDKRIPETQHSGIAGCLTRNLTRPACDTEGCPDEHGNR